MLTKAELNYLKGLKRFNDISNKQIEEELINLIGSQKGFKELKKENNLLKKRLERKEREIKKMEEKSKRTKKQIFNLKNRLNMKRQRGKELPKRIIKTKDANIFQLKRILCFLEESEKPLLKKEIFEECGLKKDQGNSAINFLVNHNLINKKRDTYSKCQQ